jgi:subtilisin family serine protease
MNRRVPVFSLCAAFAVAACSPDNVAAPVKRVAAPNFLAGAGSAPRHIVLMAPGAAPADFASRVEALGGTVRSLNNAAGVAVVSGLSAAASTQLAASGVGSVQSDFQVSLENAIAPVRADASEVASPEVNSADNPATAARFNRQWNMRLINAPAAWTAGKLGSSAVTVAIIDTGIDYDLPDLDGLVDLSRSHSFMDTFVGQSDNPATPEFDASPIVPSDDFLVTHIGLFAGRDLITDLNGHGSNVATQVSSNAVRYAGVTSRTKLIGVKVLGANGVGSFSDILNGVLWAADHGADVANMSLGGGFSKAGNGDALAAINQVFNYAATKGMLIVVSAGNSGINLQHIGNGFSNYCDAPHVICVSSVGPALATDIGTPAENAGAFYTNFGKNSVDVAAPGGNADAAHAFKTSAWPWGTDIASWVWSYCAKQSLIIQRNTTDETKGDIFLTTCFKTNPATLLNNGYIGTSQASPHVAGLAALLIAQNGKGSPNQIKQLIQKSGLATNKALGRGRIDVAAALGL